MANRDIKESEDYSDVMLDGEEEVETETPLNINPLIIKLSPEKEQELAAILKEDLTNAEEARQQKDWGTDGDNSEGMTFEEKYQTFVDLYEGKTKSRPEKWMCRRSVKIAQAIVEMLVARLLPMIWNPNTFNWKAVEKTDKKLREQVKSMMEWVVLVWMKMGKDVEDIIRAACMMGTVFVETYWDVKKYDTNKTEQTPLIDDLTGEPMLDEDGTPTVLEQKLFRIEEKPAISIIPITKFLTQPGADDLDEEPVIKLEDTYLYKLEQQEREGLAYNIDNIRANVEKKLEDKVDEALSSAQNFSMAAKKRIATVETVVWWGQYDVDDDGFDEEIGVVMDRATDTIIRIFKTADVSRRGKRPFNKIDFLRRLYGSMYSIGVLEQVKPLAEEVDACFWQMQDANTLGIMKWGFYDPNSDYDPSTHVAKPRAMYPVSNPTQNVYFPTMDVPVERLLNAIRLILEFIERLTAASSYMMGKESNIVGGSGTATRTAAIQQSANIRFNLPASNIQRGLADVLRNILDLCAMNAPEGLEKRILGEDGEEIFSKTDDFEKALSMEFDVYLQPDPTFGDTDMERELAVVLYDKFVMGGNPFVAQNPDAIYYASANVLKSFGETPEDWLGNPRSKKETNDPVEENTIIREGMSMYAEPQENHLEHIMIHRRVLEADDVALWSKEALMMLRTHIQEHQQMMQQVMMMTQQRGGTNAQVTRGAGADAGRPSPTGSQFGLQSDANPTRGAVENQAQGTMLGTQAAPR